MKIVTYNIHKGMDANNNITLIKIGKYLKNLDCDVICLQEVLHPQFIKLKHQLRMNGIFATNVNKPPMLYGICTFTKQKIDYSSHILLTSTKEQRGLLCVSINNENIKLNIINTHLGLNKYERYNQINEILDYTYRLTGNIAICGDFNEKNISLNNFKDTAIISKKYDEPTFEKSNSRIDYIFVDEGLNVENYYIDKKSLSDHYPVIGIYK